jgi:hypothetical protein
MAQNQQQQRQRRPRWRRPRALVTRHCASSTMHAVAKEPPKTAR